MQRLNAVTGQSKQWIKHHVPPRWYWHLRRLQRRVVPSLRRLDREEAAFAATLVRPGQLCFDIGCHLGLKAVAMRSAGARVVGVEPEPLVRQLCSFEFEGDADFVLEPVGIADQPGRLTLHRSDSLAMSSFDASWNNGDDGIEVEVTTLDALIERHGRPEWCKVDVEGFEEQVFAGLSAPIPLVSFEFHAAHASRAVHCLKRLALLGATEANVTPMDACGFLFDEPITIDAMIGHLESDWVEGRTGDIYVWSPVSATA